MLPKEEEEAKQVRRKASPSAFDNVSWVSVQAFRDGTRPQKGRYTGAGFQSSEFVGLKQRFQLFLNRRSKTSRRTVFTYGYWEVTCIDRKIPLFFISFLYYSLA